MAGRRRRGSTSTIASLDVAPVKWVKEGAILKPTPPGTGDEAWTCFELHDAMVYHKDGKRLGNPLYSALEGPFVVRGRLEIDEEEQEAQLVNPSVKSALIQIDKSWAFSIGVLEEGYPVLWVSGGAGWFELKPAREYEAVYNDICDAIALYYNVMDVYERYNEAKQNYQTLPKKRRLAVVKPEPPTIDEILFEYATAVGDGCTLDEVRHRCDKWAQFLISQFPKETSEGVRWSETEFHDWLIARHPDLRERLLQAADESRPKRSSSSQPVSNLLSSPARKVVALPEPDFEDSQDQFRLDSGRSRDTSNHRSGKAARHALRQEDVVMSDAPSPQERETKSTRATPARLNASAPSPASSRPDTPPGPSDYNAQLTLLLEVFAEIAQERGAAMVRTAPSTVHSALYMKCKIKPYGVAKEIIEYFAKPLSAQLPGIWRGTSFYKGLADVAARPQRSDFEFLQVSELPQLLARRKKSVVRPLPKAEEGEGTDSLAEDERDVKKKKRHGPGRPETSRTGGKVPGLRLATVGGKRRLVSDVDSDGTGSSRGKKTAKTAHLLDDFEETDDSEAESDEPTSPQNEAEEDDDDDVDGPSVPFPKDAVRVVVHAERVPSTVPTGPRGTWTCDEAGCGFVVRSAEEKEGRELIQQHFREHEASEDKIDLAMREGRGHHINHLLEKIQAVGRHKTVSEQQTLDGEPVVAPIKRRLII